MLHLTNLDGTPVVIFTTKVCYMQPTDDNTLISFEGGSTVVVMEDYATVLEMLSPESKKVGF